jgi:hypothetical protein
MPLITIYEYLAQQENSTTEWAKEFVQGLAMSPVHSGDCTKEIHSCNLCTLEDLLVEYREYVFGKTCATNN